MVPVDALKHFLTNTMMLSALDNLPEHLNNLQQRYNETNNKQEREQIILLMTEYIWKFSLFEVKIDWIPIIQLLLVIPKR